MDSNIIPTDRFCSICQTQIGDEERFLSCPGCHLPFHTDCWGENRGCSAYGCAQVNVLQKAEIRIEALPTVASVSGSAAVRRLSREPPELPFPWEFLLLAGSVLMALTSLVVFGIPSLLSGAATVVSFWMIHPKKSSVLVLVLSLLFSWVGFVLGVISSTLIWQEGVL